MKNKTIVKLALSTAMVGFTALGGASVIASNTTTEIAASMQSKKAHGWAKKAEKLFAKGQTDKALGYAEAAVGADLTNVEYRSLLARIYMAQGRFTAAERTFADVMELGQVDARTVVGAALSRIAQGKADSAIALVDAHRSLLPASDYGLALGLAGDSKRSVDVLVEAIRGENASARTRQNLALAYALDGRWREARIMAVQDMPQDRVDDRIAEWAQFARPGAYQTRVAGLLKVTPREDNGQPVRLALGGAVSAPAMAAAEESAPVAVAMAAPAPTGELPAIGAAPDVEGYAETDVRVAEAVPMAAIEAPLIRAPITPVKSAEAAPAAKPVKLALADIPAAQPKISGKYLVQLGAFSSTANATRAWSQLNRKHRILNGFDSASSTVTVKGRTLTRLAATGFGNFETADAACRQIKMSGGECIVRSTSGSSPVRMASKMPARKAVRIAAR